MDKMLCIPERYVEVEKGDPGAPKRVGYERGGEISSGGGGG